MRRTGARLGQHFLNAQWVSRDLVKSLSLRADEPILEIGPGRGALTKELLATGHRVIAIEKDENLMPLLRDMFSRELTSGQLTLVSEDIRDIDPAGLGLAAGDYVLAANIPYYITGEIIRKFLETSAQPRTMALLIQKEVAERIVARDGKESILSISVKAYGSPSIVAKVPAGCFNPPPSVDSAILLIERVSRDFFKSISEQRFFEIVRAGFSSKRKKLVSNLRSKVSSPEEICSGCSVSLLARAEDLTLHHWQCIAAE